VKGFEGTGREERETRRWKIATSREREFDVLGGWQRETLQENRFTATKPFHHTKVLISLLDVPSNEIVH
jgi:hypothetical protein